MATNFWEALGAIPDRRGRKGRQFTLQAILSISVAAMLAGANDLRAIFRWGRRLKPEALALFGIERAPCHATYHYVFQSLDGDALAKELGRFARGGAQAGHIAIDGKTLKGSRRLDAKALHVLSAFATGLSAVIDDIVVEPGQNEITAALVFLKNCRWRGRSLRAMRCSASAKSAKPSMMARRLSVCGERQSASTESQYRRKLRRHFPLWNRPARRLT